MVLFDINLGFIIFAQLFAVKRDKLLMPFVLPEIFQIDVIYMPIEKRHIRRTKVAFEHQTPDVIIDRAITAGIPAGRLLCQIQVYRHRIGVFGPGIHPQAVKKHRH